MKATQQADRTFHLSFGYDPEKTKLCRVLGGEFVKDGGVVYWKVADPTMCELLRRAQKKAISDGADFYQTLLADVRGTIRESQSGDPVEMDFDVPDGKRLLKSQHVPIRWILTRESTLEADPMGAGKTVICSVAANKMKAKRVLIICLASIKANWRREWKAWNKMAASGEQTVAVASGSFWPNTDVVIVNYDILDRFRTQIKMEKVEFIHGGKKRTKWVPVLDDDGTPVIQRVGQIDSVEWDLVIIDECHKIKGRRADRTVAVVGVSSYGKQLQTPISAKRRIAMSGTPIVNRPAEIWPAAFWLWPESFPNFHMFGMRYCAGKRSGWGKTWNFDGSSNAEELNIRLRLLGMISRPKSITHSEVPPKVRKIIEYGIDGFSKLVSEERTLVEEFEKDLVELRAAALVARLFGEEDAWREAMKGLKERCDLKNKGVLRAARVSVTRAALPQIIEYIKDELNERDKVAVFCWHREIADALQAAFPGSAKISGDVATEDRQPQIDRFQNDASCKVFVGTIASCGTGITITATSLILFVEICDVPGEVMQAEDRAHRQGQKATLEIRYLVPEGSAMAIQCENIINKMEVIDGCVGQITDSALMDMPVSAIEDDESAPVAAIEFAKLEQYSKTIQPTKVYSVRDRLLQIARGRYRRRPADVDQIVCGRLANRDNWTPIQQAMAELLVKRYGVENDADFNGKAGLF